MALEIRTFGDPVLKTRAAEVTKFDAFLQHLGEQMLETLRADGGRMAIAANQVGRLKRIFVAETEDEQYVAVNPVVEERSEELQTGPEGCLSIPGIAVEAERHEGVVVTGQDAEGHPVRFEVTGEISHMMQHEIDHLDGILMLDRTDQESRKQALREWRERLLSQS